MVRVDGRKLRQWRERRLMTLRALGERSGVQFHTIHAIEAGKQEPRISTIKKLVEALGIPPEELLTLDGRESDDREATGKAAA